MKDASLSEVARGAWKAVMLFAMVAAGVCDFWLRRPKSVSTRSRVRRVWCARILRSLGVSLTVHGEAPRRGIAVSNHLSYLDIVVLGSAFDGVFVSKREVRRWPLIGLFTYLAGTIYVDRSRRATSSRTVDEMCDVLDEDVPVMFFPEGTSSDGSHVLRFRAALFQAALDTEEPVFPASIEYRIAGSSAGVADKICYFGDMTFFPHLLRFLRLRDVSATVQFGRALFVARDRFDMATQAQVAVAQLAGLPMMAEPEEDPTVAQASDMRMTSGVNVVGR